MYGLGGIVRFCDGTLALALDDCLVYKSLRLTPSSRFRSETLSPQVYWPKAKRHSIDTRKLRTNVIFTESQLIVLNSIRAWKHHQDVRHSAVALLNKYLFTLPVKAHFSQPPFKDSPMLTGQCGAIG